MSFTYTGDNTYFLLQLKLNDQELKTSKNYINDKIFVSLSVPGTNSSSTCTTY